MSTLLYEDQGDKTLVMAESRADMVEAVEMAQDDLTPFEVRVRGTNFILTVQKPTGDSDQSYRKSLHRRKNMVKRSAMKLRRARA